MAGNTGQLIKSASQQASRAASHPGAVAGRTAQTADHENAAPGGHSPWDVLTRTGEGVRDNHRKGRVEQALSPAPLFGLSSPFLARGAMEAFPAAARAAGLAGHGIGGAAGMLVAGFEAAKSLGGIYKGLKEDYHSSEFGDGTVAAAGEAWDKFKDFLHVGDGPAPQGVLGHFGALVGAMTAAEQALSTLASAIPFPAIPAVRVLDLDVGLPHLHAHPPNVPGPGALPSTGPVIPIPYVSGAATVLINGMPAARCGDMGLGIWCGGYFPMFEIFLGSSSVWLEGARAARVGLLTKHCIFSNPKSIVKGGDNPIGAPLGFLVGSSPNVIIGGVPLPSLTSMALGGMFKALFKGLGKLAGAIGRTTAFSKMAAAAKNSKLGQKFKTLANDMGKFRKPKQGKLGLLIDSIKSRRMVDRLLKKRVVVIADGGDRALREWIEQDLRKVASTKTGRGVLSKIEKSGHQVTIESIHSSKVHPDHIKYGPHHLADDAVLSHTPGSGSGSRVRVDPHRPYTDQLTSDRILAHELGHSKNSSGGNLKDHLPPPNGDRARWTDLEEFENIRDVDNPYGKEWGKVPRQGHNHVPGTLDANPPIPPPAPPPAPPAPPRTTSPGMGAAGPTPSPAPPAPAPAPAPTPAPAPAPAPPPPPGGGGPSPRDTIPDGGPDFDDLPTNPGRSPADTIPDGGPDFDDLPTNPG